MAKCKICGAQIAASAKVCPSCGGKQKKPVYKQIWFWVVLVLVVAGVIGSVSSGSDREGSANQSSAADNLSSAAAAKDPASSSSAPSVFDGDCGITATAEIGPNMINFPELKIDITNTTDKEIAAIKFYIVPYDVYGEQLTGPLAENGLITDNSIAAGSSATRSWQLLEQHTHDVDLYVYSVYFSDGTEWGDRNASENQILKEAVQLDVTVKS